MTLQDVISCCWCPSCHSTLQVDNDFTSVHCSQNHRFPVLDKKIIMFNQKAKTLPQPATVGDKATSQSFSTQWQMYKEGNKIWGLTKSEWIDLFFRNSGLTREQIKNKFILDLGCGHGVYSATLAEMGARVIGFDISTGFYSLVNNLPDTLEEKIFFIQGDIFDLPFKEGTFDFVWCDGVLHHTPDTKKAFDIARPTIKRGGRLYIWLYKKAFYTQTINFVRFFTTKIPKKLLVFFCYTLAPFYAFAKLLFNVIKSNYRFFEKRSLRENALSLHDTFAPPYRWIHSIPEVTSWFKEAKFDNITVSEDIATGFGMYADKK